MSRQPFRNWGDHPFVVLLGSLAALATILAGVYSLNLTKSRARSGPEADAPAAPLKLDISCFPVADLLDVNQEGIAWAWSCSLQNSSDSTMIWENTFAAKGARLRWYCAEFKVDLVVTGNVSPGIKCSTFNFSPRDIAIDSNGSISFIFLKSGEKFNFKISCSGVPSYCRAEGRAPNVAVNKVEFFGVEWQKKKLGQETTWLDRIIIEQ